MVQSYLAINLVKLIVIQAYLAIYLANLIIIQPWQANLAIYLVNLITQSGESNPLSGQSDRY